MEQRDLIRAAIACTLLLRFPLSRLFGGRICENDQHPQHLRLVPQHLRLGEKHYL